MLFAKCRKRVTRDMGWPGNSLLQGVRVVSWLRHCKTSPEGFSRPLAHARIFREQKDPVTCMFRTAIIRKNLDVPGDYGEADSSVLSDHLCADCGWSDRHPDFHTL